MMTKMGPWLARFTSRVILPAVVAVSLGISSLLTPNIAVAADVTVYKSPSCGCCSGWVDHMRRNGHKVKAINRDDLDGIKRMLGVPGQFQSCHTAIVDGYVIEGHVPASDVEKLLTERPKAKGLAVPGMPGGSPGMEGAAKEPYSTILFKNDGSASVYSMH